LFVAAPATIMRGIVGNQREPWVTAAAAADAGAWAAPTHLVLMVARQRAPHRELLDCLAQRGLRGIWIDGLQAVGGVVGQVVPDAVVFDARADGSPLPAALAQLRGWFGGPLLVLDGSADEVDQILALELGADGQLAHPVSPRLLRARLEALLRRPARAAAPLPCDHDERPPELPAGWHLDAVHNRLHRGERSVALSAGQLHLLRCLALHGGRVVPRADLHRQVCAPESDLRARSIDVYVHRLRQRLLAAGVYDLSIHAVRGRGFMLRSEAQGALAAMRANRGAADTCLQQ